MRHLRPSRNRAARRATCAALFLCATAIHGCGTSVASLPTNRLIYPLPILVGIPYEDVALTSENGETIHGWFIPADDAPATVLINHGAWDNRSSLVEFYQLFHTFGYNVFIYDYQGFGESFAPASISTILPDARAALEHVKSRTETGTDRIILFGISMGTLPTFALAAENDPAVVGAIFEGSFAFEDLPQFAFFLLGITPTEYVLDTVPPELVPQQYLDDIHLPKLFLQSLQDSVTPFNSAQALFDQSPEPKQFAPLIGYHTKSIIIDPTYGLILNGWLTSILGDPP